MPALWGINTLNFETVNDATSGILATYSGGSNTSVEAFLSYNGSSTQSTFFGAGGDETAFFGSSALAAAYQARTGTTTLSYNSIQAGLVSTINGSDYSSGATNAANSGTFTFDNIYSGASTVLGHAGADIFIDNIGTNAESFNGNGDSSNIYYMSPTQVASVSITGNSAHLNELRVESWGATTTTGNAFGTTDPFSTAKITGITEIDVRKGTDTVNTGASSITSGATATVNSSAPNFQLNDTDIQNITAVSSTPTLVLKLDNGDTFSPTGTVSTVVSGNTTTYYNSTNHIPGNLLATDTHNGANYYSDVVVFNTTNHATLNIHYGTG